MEELSIDDLRAELARLEAEEAKLSANRKRLQHQIDFGFENESTRNREREVSDERGEVHRRIDALKEQLRERESGVPERA
jgi:chromosome segregation ATPase